jgi:hypothetical protein
VGTIRAKVARFAPGFVFRNEARFGLGLPPDALDRAKKRFEIRKPRRGMSIVRAGREIDTIDHFPTAAGDRHSGLGRWPLLQSYAYYWGAEVWFTPELDEAFGIGNDKQTVSPIEDFWRVLHDAGMDTALNEEQRYQSKMRRKEDEDRAVAEASAPDQPNPATEAAAQAEKIVGGTSRVSDEQKRKSQEKMDQEAKEHAKAKNIPLEEAKEAVAADTKRKKYRIEFFEADGGVFYKPEIGPNLVKIAKINRAHPFFKQFYARLVKTGDPRARQAVDLLLLALAKGELEAGGGAGPADEELAGSTKARFYEHEREQKWSPFLGTALKILDHMESMGGDGDEVEDDDIEEDDESTSPAN